ncbi:hypothetical protein POPTR_006G240450v4 [Populus trichocarpa]|uniref:Uncharacterized protein n=1 Tax=Populus trichocarpa TaxID=3694 RepID=A0ACC0SWB3_POPTR|nr:hypothetical protein POPTR_006G240450v4 [Populus trichocarpa]
MHTRRLHLVSICFYAARNCMFMVHLWRCVSIRLHGEVSREISHLGTPRTCTYCSFLLTLFDHQLSLSLSLSHPHARLLGRYRSSENGWTWLVKDEDIN